MYRREDRQHCRPLSVKNNPAKPVLYRTVQPDQSPSSARVWTLATRMTGLTQEVLLDLPHRQFVFAIPKALRLFFRHDRKLYSEVSRLIYGLMLDFYREAVGTKLMTDIVIAH